MPECCWHETCSASGQILRLPGIRPFSLLQQHVHVHVLDVSCVYFAVAEKEALGFTLSLQLTLCRSLPVVRATARPRHTDSDRVVRREVLERCHIAGVKSPRAGLPPAACEGGGTPFVCGVRCGMHAHRSLLTLTTRLVAHPHTRSWPDAYWCSQFGTLTPDHRHLSGTSHPYTFL